MSDDAFGRGGRNRVVGAETAIQLRRAPIVMDGNVDEWAEDEAILLTTAGGSGRLRGPFDDHSARIALRYDDEALYAALWWRDPTPLDSETTAGVVPATDGLVLHIPGGGEMHHLALWKVPGEDRTRALHSVGRAEVGQGRLVEDVEQGFQVTGPNRYTQEVRIPWTVVGGKPENAARLRLGVELCFGGLDLTGGYQAWGAERAENSRWGGNIGWGFVDGVRDDQIASPGNDPANGAIVELAAVGTRAPDNPPGMFYGDEQTRTKRMVAVPAKGNVVDGKLEDGEWDAATATRISSEPSLFPRRYETDMHWAYDDQGLYVGMRWHTGGQHVNVNDPARINRGFDGGDAIQIRLGTGRVSHLDVWFHTAGQRPAMAIAYGLRFNEGQEPDAIAKGARVAVAPQPMGYTQEIFIPWELITQDGKPLVEGDSFRVVMSLFYSGVEGNRLPFIVNAALQPSSGVVDLPFTAPRDGFYTAVIEDAQGRGVRRLLAHSRLPVGAIIDWDGLDDVGEPVPAGSYRFRGLHHTGVGLDYLTCFMNPGNPPWRVFDGAGEWGGDHCPPQAVAADNNSIYLGWPAAEDGDGIIACDTEGRKVWGFYKTPFPVGAGTMALAVDGDYLFMGMDALYEKRGPRSKTKDNTLAKFGSHIACIDRRTGRRAGFSVDKPFIDIASFDIGQENWAWDLWQSRDFSLDTYGIHDDYFFSGRVTSANLTGIAARGGRLYVSLRITNEVVVFQVEPFKELARWKVPKPGGLAFNVRGELLAISGQTVVRLDEKGQATPVVTTGLEAPVAVAVDADGNIYVSQWGKAQCVAVFDTEGRPLRTIGKLGGRPIVGAYDPGGMIMPRGIAIDREGQLWVAEDDNHPRRVSVWNPRTGELIRDFIGGTTYGGNSGGIIDPERPDRAVDLGNLYAIDLERSGYQILTTMWRRLHEDQIFPLHGGWIHNTGFIEHEGRRFIHNGAMGYRVIGKLLEDGTWQPVAAIGGIFNRSDNSMVVKDENRWWRQSKYPDFLRQYAGSNFVWTDLNDDGRAQPEEFQWEKQTDDFPCLGLHWGSGKVTDNMDVIIASHTGDGHIWRFPRLGWTDNGAPRYDIEQRELLHVPGERVDAVSADRDGNVLTSQCTNQQKPGFQPMLRSHAPGGALRWEYPVSRDPRPMGNVRGKGILGPVDAGGELGEIFSLGQWWGLHAPLMTTDGLFVGRLLRDPAAGGDSSPEDYRGESLQNLNRLADGRVILTHGKNAHLFFQVTGLDTARRFAGDFQLGGEQARMAAERRAARADRETANAPIRMGRREQPPTIDGNLDDWDFATAATIGDADAAASGKVMLAYDAQNIYLAYEVIKSGGYINQGDDVLRLFQGGDAVDLHFAADPAAKAERRETIIGDTRLLIARHHGQEVAVIYRAKVPGTTNPVEFRSPTTTVTFDQVEILRDAKIAIRDTETGYQVEAAIPSKALISDFIWPGRILRGDAGFILADRTSRRVARVYRFNRNTDIVDDEPTEARLQPSEWGEIEVARQDR